MRVFIFIFILAAFLQTAFIPINLCLILLICRSFALEDDLNYWMGFFGGIMLSALSSANLGFWTFAFLITVKFIQLAKILPISSNFFTIIPISFIVISLVGLLESFFFEQSFNLMKVFIETAITLPTYILVRFWEDRFMMRQDVRLKIKK
jgi:hypothetical protein